MISWIASTEAEVALVAATPKTVISVISGAGKQITVPQFKIDFDGVTAAAEPVLVQLMRSSQSTAGTSSSVTPRRKRGPVSSSSTATARSAFTVEPTVLTLIEDYAVDPYKGLFVIQYPLGREPDAANGEAILLRLDAPAGVNVRAFIEYEEG